MTYSTGSTARELNNELREIEYLIGTISRVISITSRLRFDPPQTQGQQQNQNVSGGSGSGGSAGFSSGQRNSDGFSSQQTANSGGVSSQEQLRVGGGMLQQSGSMAMTGAGGYSAGAGVRVGDGNKFGFSAVSTETRDASGNYQASGGISGLGVSINGGLSIQNGQVSLTGGVQRSSVGQGIVGPTVGPKIVGDGSGSGLYTR